MSRLPPVKCFLAAVVLLVITAPLGYLLFYQVRICHNRFEMLERLEKENLHSITLSPTDFHWVIPGKEIKIKGRLFDVKNILRNGKTITVTGIFDDEEEELDRMISRSTDPDHNKLPFLVKMVTAPVIQWQTFGYLPFATLKCKPSPKRYIPMLPLFYKDPLCPPPRLAA